MFYIKSYFLFIAFLWISNFSYSLVKCFFINGIVFFTYSMSICLLHHLLVLDFLMASFDKCFFFDRFPCFFQGASTMQSISRFTIAQHSVAVLFSSVLFQSIFAKYFVMSLYIRLWIYFLYRVFRFRSPFTLMIKCNWLWSLHPSSSHIFILSPNSFCEL